MRLLSSAHSTAHAALAFANCWMTNWAALCCSQSSENRSNSAVLRSDSRALLTWEMNIYSGEWTLGNRNTTRLTGNEQQVKEQCNWTTMLKEQACSAVEYYEKGTFLHDILSGWIYCRMKCFWQSCWNTVIFTPVILILFHTWLLHFCWRLYLHAFDSMSLSRLRSFWQYIWNEKT